MFKKRLKDLEAKYKDQQQMSCLTNPLVIFNYDSKDLNHNEKKTKYVIKYFKKDIEIHTDDLEGFYKEYNLIPKINCNPIELKVCKNRTEADFYSKINTQKMQKKWRLKMDIDNDKVKEVQREYNRNYYKNNKDKINERQNKWRRENKDKVRQYNKNYWLKKAKLMQN